MLGIGCPDRHALPHFNPSKTTPTATSAPSRASGFVLRRNLVIAGRSGEGLFTCDLPTFATVLAERSKHRAKSNFSISGCSTERGRRRRRNLERQGSLSELGQSALARGNHAMEPLSNKLA
jgi:hypothetical protein